MDCWEATQHQAVVEVFKDEGQKIKVRYFLVGVKTPLLFSYYVLEDTMKLLLCFLGGWVVADLWGMYKEYREAKQPRERGE